MRKVWCDRVPSDDPLDTVKGVSVSISRTHGTVTNYRGVILHVGGVGQVCGKFDVPRSYHFEPARYSGKKKKAVVDTSARPSTPVRSTEWIESMIEHLNNILPTPVRKESPVEEEVRSRHRQRMADSRFMRGRQTKAQRRFITLHNARVAAELARTRKRLRPQVNPFAAGLATGVVAAGCVSAAVRRLTRKIKTSTDGIMTRVEAIVERIDGTAERATGSANRVLDSVHEHFPAFMGCVKNAAIATLLILALKKRSSSMAVIAGALAVLLPGNGLATRLTRRTLDAHEGVLVPQAGIDAKSIAVTAVVALMGGMFFKQRTHRNSCLIATFLASVGNFDRLTAGWESFVSFFCDLVEKFVHFMGSLAGKEWNIKLLADPYPDISRHTKQVTEFVDKVRLGALPVSCATVRAVRAFLSNDAQIRIRHHSNRKAMAMLQTATSGLAYLQEAFGPLISGKTGQRPQPPVVMLCGPPGVGKSILTTDILDFALAETLDPEVKACLNNDYSGEMYLYPVEEDFANGYAGQACAIFEDVGLGITALGDRKADFLRIASLANPYSKPLDQAAIAGKGNSFFQSDIIYCTTNVYNIAKYVEGHIHEPAALMRRLSVPYRIVLRDDWAEVRDGVKQLNYQRYAQFRAENPTQQPDAWLFVRWDYATGRAVAGAPVLGLEGFKLKIVDEIMKNRAFYTDTSKYRRDINLSHVPKYVPGMEIPAADVPIGALAGLTNTTLLTPQAGEDEDTARENALVLYQRFASGAIPLPPDLQRSFESLDPPGEEDDFVEVEGPPLRRPYWELLRELDPRALFEHVMGNRDVYADWIAYWHNTSHRNLNGDGDYVGPRVAWRGFDNAESDHKHMCWVVDSFSKKDTRVSKLKMYAYVATGCWSPVGIFRVALAASFMAFMTYLVTRRLVGFVMGLVKTALTSVFSFFTGIVSSPFKKAKSVTWSKYRKGKRLTSQSNEGPVPRVRPFINHLVTPQGATTSLLTSTSTREAVLNKVQANTYAVYCCTTQPIGFATFVRDKVMMMPYHYLASFQKASSPEVRFVNVVSGQVLVLATTTLLTVDDTVGRLQRIDMPDLDIMFFQFPNARAHCDVVSYYAPSAVTELRPKGVHIGIRSFKATYDGPAVSTTSFVNGCSHRRDFGYVDSTQRVRLGYDYAIGYNHGDCGAMAFFASDPKQEQSPMIGYHVASKDKNSGTCNVVAREVLEDACRQFSAIRTTVEATPYSGLLIPQAGTTSHRNMAVVYQTATPHNVNLRTELRESEMYGAYGPMPKCAPNFMPFVNQHGEEIVPLHKALAPYATDVQQFDPREVRQAMASALRPLNELTLNSSREVYDFRQAVEGIPGVFKGIPRGTSCGGQYVLRGFSNKRAIFGKDLYEFDTPLAEECFNNVQSILADAKAGIRQPHVYVEFPKDELLKRQKVEEDGKVRLISACPLDLMVATRMMFLAFSTAVMETKIDNHIAVGINPYKHWDRLASRLRSRGVDCVAGDFSRFDASEQPQILEEIVHHINLWYNDGEDNARIRRVLWQEVVHSLHLSGLGSSRRDVLQWCKSLPSGHPLTSIINSIYNLTLFHMCWNRLCPFELKGYYYDYCYLCVLGDDNIQNIARSVTEWWNQHTITAAMATLHMTYTDETKSGGVPPPTRSLVDCSFCKRTFRPTPFGWEGPLEIDSIVWSPYVVRAKAPSPRSIMEDNIELALGELSIHASDVWRTWSEKIVNAARVAGYIPRRYVSQDIYHDWITSYDPPYL